MRRIFLFLFALFALGGCARAPREAGTLRLTTSTDPSKLDPALSYDTTSINFVRVLYRGLVDYDDKALIAGVVAKNWTVSPDGKTYTFRLRNDVKFHSGRRVVAEDFRYAIERVLDPKTASDGLTFYKIIQGASQWSEAKAKNPKLQSHVPGIAVRGEDEIAFRLVQPDVTFLNVLALPFAYAVPREWVEQLAARGETLSDHPNGCGPFKFVEWQHNASLKLERNPAYFQKGLPRCERIELQIGGDETLGQMRFELGDFDVQTDIPATDFARLKKDPGKLQVQHAPMMDIRYLCMNNEVAPFNDVRVRRAFNYAIDKARLLPLRSGRIQAARGVLPQGMPGYNPNLRGYEYDPEKAKQLLKQAGKSDLKLTLWTSKNDDYDKMAVSIQDDLKKVGVQLDIKIVTYPELKTLAGKRGKIGLCILGWLQDYADPANFLDVLFNGNKITDTASLNRAFYSNPKVNKLLDKAGVETDVANRLKMYGQAEQQIVDDAPWVFLYHSERYIVTQPWVSGYKRHAMWSARYEYVAVNGKQ